MNRVLENILEKCKELVQGVTLKTEKYAVA